jgi:hypothetical protein
MTTSLNGASIEKNVRSNRWLLSTQGSWKYRNGEGIKNKTVDYQFMKQITKIPTTTNRQSSSIYSMKYFHLSIISISHFSKFFFFDSIL